MGNSSLVFFLAVVASSCVLGYEFVFWVVSERVFKYCWVNKDRLLFLRFCFLRLYHSCFILSAMEKQDLRRCTDSFFVIKTQPLLPAAPW